MPRSLDLEARRAEIIGAGMELLARGGGRALTIKALAAALGGSTTLITHIFRRKEDIYDAIAEHVAEEVRTSVAPAGSARGPMEDLRAFIEWCIPLEPADLEYERLRFAFLERSQSDPSVQALIDIIDDRLRQELTVRLRPLVSADDLPRFTDLLRALTNGAILSVVEHPGDWTAARQLAVVELVLASITPPDGRQP